ncbi:MAG: efflux RND transporter periplasmic adaptor subunit [Planctomycetes bacterium]|nr:efflux RND transporter periplasmic adaptor subunit [Planctomycetota bacterium]
MRRSRRFAVTVLALALGGAAGCGKGPPQLPPPEPPTVATVKPRTVPLQAIKEFTGRLVTKEPVKVTPQVSGRLLSRDFDEGKPVEAGKTVLYHIDPVLFRADVDKAKADIARAKADIANWTAQTDRDKAEYARQKQQSDAGAGSKFDLDKALASVKVSEAQIDVSKAAKAAAESALVKAEENLKYCTIYAPTTGVAGRSPVAPNNLVDAYKTELVTIYPVDELYAEWEVDEQTSLWYREQIKSGAFGDPHAPATAIRVVIRLKDEKQFSTDAADKSRHSVVDVIDPEIVRQTGTRTLRATFQNPLLKDKTGRPLPRLLSAGDSVRVRLFSGAPRPVLTVPETVVFTQQRKQYVYVVADGKAQLREVEPGATIDGTTEVNRRASPAAPTGLDESDTVIADNLLRVRPGVPVTVK